MKKTLLIILSALLLMMSLVACGNTTDDPSTDNNKETDKAPAASGKFEPEIISKDKIDPRQKVVDSMIEMSEVEWIPMQDLDFSTVLDTLYYKSGVKYTGMIYVTGARENHVDAEGFKPYLNEKGEYTGPTTPTTAIGNHCSSSIRISYNTFSNKATFATTVQMMPGVDGGMEALGNYVYSASDKTTEMIFANNRGDTQLFAEGYALLQKGDAILFCDGKTGHTRIVIENTVAKDSAGKIDLKNSYVITIEQTSSFDTERRDVNTTWFVNHKYTYADLIGTKYIPLTFKGFKDFDGVTEDNTFSVKSVNNKTNLTSGKLKGIVTSSYLEIDSVLCEVLDSEGKVVVSQKLDNINNAEKTKFQFKNAEADEGFTKLKAGDYVYQITANTAFGSAKVHQKNITIE